MSFDLLIPFLRPIEPLLLDDDVSEIMGNPNATWYAEREGQLLPQPEIAFDPGSLRTGLEVIANNLGKRLDEDNPVLEAQLPDGSRICAYIPPAVKPRPGLTIRKFTGRHFAADDLIARGTISRRLADYLADQIRSGKTLLISGGTGTGKTTLLNVLAQSIPDEERIVTIEDTAELRIPKPNLVSFECQTDTFKEPLSFEKLLRTALRCRPDRIIVGEVGSSSHVNFTTSKTSRWETDSRRCHINWVILDSDWEAEFCRVAENHPRVRAYVKNHNLGFDVPYRHGSESHMYRPDFIVLVEDGHGEDDLLHLVVEVKGYRREDAKDKKLTMENYWIPGVNNGEKFGRWAFAEFTEVFAMDADFAARVESEFRKIVASVSEAQTASIAQ